MLAKHRNVKRIGNRPMGLRASLAFLPFRAKRAPVMAALLLSNWTCCAWILLVALAKVFTEQR